MIVVYVVIFLFAFLSGGLIGALIEESGWKKMTVKKGLAQYNSKTGKWEWKKK